MTNIFSTFSAQAGFTRSSDCKAEIRQQFRESLTHGVPSIMRRMILVFTRGGLVGLTVVWYWAAKSTPAQAPAKSSLPAKPIVQSLPVTQAILFNSGVGYFQREGEVQGSMPVDLSFSSEDLNDLLKSLVLQDLDGGKITSIAYDSQDPIEKTLRSFALDLTYNPTYGQILNQARGEKIELTLQGSKGAAGTLTGIIAGMEFRQKPGPGENLGVACSGQDFLNLLCSDGFRSVPLEQVERVQFQNSALDEEIRRGLAVLATAHDTQKKKVRLNFSGEAKRTVRVGYVLDNPIWKTSYRLIMNKDGKAILQGWALVENVSDQDWNNVRLVLVSGRPISYQMDLYAPLYVPRPIVEPELFASLRPPNYSGPLTMGGQLGQLGALGGGGLGLGGLGLGLGLGGLGGGGFPAGGAGMANLGLSGGFGGNQYQLGNYRRALPNFQRPAGPAAEADEETGRLTFETLQKRREDQKKVKETAKKVGQAITDLDSNQTFQAVASGEEIGNHYQYVIDQKVSLPRKKSAMLPILNNGIVITPVSTFNEAVQEKFPLLGLRLKNTTGQHLTQGPITVYEAGSYAGDSRIMDLQPSEERLLSYAVDFGTEIKAEEKNAPQQLVGLKIVKGVLEMTSKLRDTKSYLIQNRSAHDRLLLIEQPVRPDWKLTAPEKPTERSREVYRFEVKVPAGKGAKQEVIEEKVILQQTTLLSLEDDRLGFYLQNAVTSPRLKEGLKKAVDLRALLLESKRDVDGVKNRLKSITEEQVRLRENLKAVPSTSAAHKRYLEKFDQQEGDFEKLQGELGKKQEIEQQRQKEYESYLAALSVE
jgi:hypothetical protein